MITLEYGDLALHSFTRCVEGPLAVAFVSDRGRHLLDGLLRRRTFPRPLNVQDLTVLLDLKGSEAECEAAVRREIYQVQTLLAIIGVRAPQLVEEGRSAWRLINPDAQPQRKDH